MNASTQPPAVHALSAAQARRIMLAAQGLLGAGPRREGVPAMLRRLGAVQLDTISVLARSHELVPYARLGPVGRVRVEEAYWGRPDADTPAQTFEYWAHAACVLPVTEWPYFAFRRRECRQRGRRWHEVPEGTCEKVLAMLAAEGPLSASELGGAKGKGAWWDWSDTKIAVEWLLDIGEVVCVRRQGWRRIYDLPERALPVAALDAEADDATCLARLVALAGASLGVATRADLADYYRLRNEQVAAVLEASGLVPVTVEGWPELAWADPRALENEPRGRHRTTLLSPFDSLIWDRKRTKRVFGFQHRLEAYVPRSQRVHGYFTMPLLSGGQLCGRVDPARSGRTLRAKQVSLKQTSATAAMAQALHEAARWVGCDEVRVEQVEPAELAAPLRREIDARAGRH